jgi:hypothetical protein
MLNDEDTAGYEALFTRAELPTHTSSRTLVSPVCKKEATDARHRHPCHHH